MSTNAVKTIFEHSTIKGEYNIIIAGSWILGAVTEWFYEHISVRVLCNCISKFVNIPFISLPIKPPSFLSDEGSSIDDEVTGAAADLGQSAEVQFESFQMPGNCRVRPRSLGKAAHPTEFWVAYHLGDPKSMGGAYAYMGSACPLAVGGHSGFAWWRSALQLLVGVFSRKRNYMYTYLFQVTAWNAFSSEKSHMKATMSPKKEQRTAAIVASSLVRAERTGIEADEDCQAVANALKHCG